VNASMLREIVSGLSHLVSKMKQVLPICMSGFSFILIVTSLVNNINNIT
jgi:hypothetical protein